MCVCVCVCVCMCVCFFTLDLHIIMLLSYSSQTFMFGALIYLYTFLRSFARGTYVSFDLHHKPLWLELLL